MTRGTRTPMETMTGLIKLICEGKGSEAGNKLCATGGRAWLVTLQRAARGQIIASLQFADRHVPRTLQISYTPNML